jgi:rfaE bifunctional protein kinase chain/domain
MQSEITRIFLEENIEETLKQLSESGRKVVLTYGHFNILHPGHQRFLKFAKDHGDILVVGVWGDRFLDNQGNIQYFSQSERAETVASIKYVNHVLIIDHIGIETVIDRLKPALLIMGKEHEEHPSKEEAEVYAQINRLGGKVLFNSGEVHYADSRTLFQTMEEISYDKLKEFRIACNRFDIKRDNLKKTIASFANKRILIFGDTIVDQYIACDGLGMSSEAPVLVVQELESTEFIGGAAIVARHLASLGCECDFISVTGDDDTATFVEDELINDGIRAQIIRDANRPTTFKKRYMVNNQKILRVSRLKDSSIREALEKEIIQRVAAIADKIDGLIICDFVYGVVTKKILAGIIELSKKNGFKLFGDLQCSSQIGNVTKFKEFDMITPTEREARIALADNESGIERIAREIIKETKCHNLLITLNSSGLIAYHSNGQHGEEQSQHFPALVASPVDVAGAGDALLASVSAVLCCGADLMEAVAIGTCVSAIAVSQIGNRPIKTTELIAYLDQVFEPDIF